MPTHTSSWGGPWGARDRSKAVAFAELVNDAIGRWEQERGEPVTPSTIAYQVSLGLGRDYQITQVRRVRTADKASFDSEVVAAWVGAIPTLDRAEAFATVGLLPPGMTAAQLRRALAPARKPRRPAANGHKTQGTDQGRSLRGFYSVLPVLGACAAEPVVSGRRAVSGVA